MPLLTSLRKLLCCTTGMQQEEEAEAQARPARPETAQAGNLRPANAGKVLTCPAPGNKVKHAMQDNDRYEFTVRVKTAYLQEQSVPEDNRFVFAYTISITNTGSVPATLLRRHWVITDANNKVQEVHGDGVVGEQPRLDPGQTFQYTSGAVLETPVGCMEGNYDMLAEDGVEFASPIPIFNLATPHTLH